MLLMLIFRYCIEKNLQKKPEKGNEVPFKILKKNLLFLGKKISHEQKGIGSSSTQELYRLN